MLAFSSSETPPWPFPFVVRAEGACAPLRDVSGGGVFMMVMGGNGRSQKCFWAGARVLVKKRYVAVTDGGWWEWDELAVKWRRGWNLPRLNGEMERVWICR